MFSIRMKGTDKWVAKSNLIHFIKDDNYFRLQDPTGKGGFSGYRQCPEELEYFGTHEKFRRLWETTGIMRDRIYRIKGESIISYSTISGIQFGVFIKKEGTIGTFSYYEVVDLISGNIYSLEDVFNKVI